MVDLHSHTNRSDGVFSPRRLIELAKKNQIRALSITDHDTLEGYDDGADYAREVGLDLICGIELSARLGKDSIHVLGYFFDSPADEAFRQHVSCLKTSRRERNARLAERLRELGCDITLDEAEALGKDQTGRPHFARLLIQKRYVSSYREAFDRYLDESAPGFVPRKEPSLENVFRWIRDSGGISSWAHPWRYLKENKLDFETAFREMADRGLLAVEAYHRDHPIDVGNQLARAARKAGLGVTGGSDFHGPSPNGVTLGGLRLPYQLLEDLKAYSRQALATAK
jgi:predicted metal-dependent phosphoesterase TrpH